MITGTLYLIPVPISEEDYSHQVYPALSTTINLLTEFIVEDVKTARRSLRKMGYNADFDKTIFHLLNNHTDLKTIGDYLSSCIKGGNVGLMSEAGMPCIADPGSEIVRRAHASNIRVVPLFGPSSIFLALAASGLNGQNFCFHGYLPKAQNNRKGKLRELEKVILQTGQTQVFIETPYRNNHLIEDVISTNSASILFCIASEVASASEYIMTKRIDEWRRNKNLDFNKKPAVFLMGK